MKVRLQYAEAHEWLTYDHAKEAWYLTEFGHQCA
jgi:hypothetical protein